MRLVSFLPNVPSGPAGAHVGVLSHDATRVVDLTAIGLEDVFAALERLEQLKRVAAHLLRSPGSVAYPADAVRLVAPVPYARTVRRVPVLEAAGKNDMLPASLAELPLPPLHFGHPADIHGPGDVLRVPASSRGALSLGIACVLGGGGRNLRDQAESHVAGYALAAEWVEGEGSELAVQLVMGPWLVTPDELADLRRGPGVFDLQLMGLNGERATPLHPLPLDTDFPAMIAEASERYLLRAGDVFVVGAGVRGVVARGLPLGVDAPRLGRLTFQVQAA